MPHNTRRQLLRASGAAGLLAALGAGRASAQALDVVKIITGFPPGGTSDTLCRRVAEGLKGGSYAKVAVVENKAGAGGQIAVQSMKGAPTDGSVILQTPASMLMIYPHIYKKLGLRPLRRCHGHNDGLHLRLRVGRRARGAGDGQDGSGLPRLVQGQPDHGELRLAGGRLRAAFHRRAARPVGRHRAEAYRLSRHAAGDPGPGRGPGPGGVRAGRRVPAAGGRRQGPHPGRLGQGRAAVSRPTCRPTSSRG